MLDIKPNHSLAALVGALALTVGVPAFAQTAAPAPSDAAAASDAAPASGLANGGAVAAPTQIKNAGKLTPIQMFLDAEPVVKVVMVGLLLCSMFSWTLLITKLIEFGSLNKASDRFLESFRTARSIADIARISTSEEFEGNPMADMAAAASSEVEVSRQAGLSVTGDHRDSTITRASAAVSAVQAGLAKRLSAGMQFLASVGSSGPFIGLFGTVYGIMNSFIGIANTNTTNLAVVAPGIAEALLATGIGLFAAIPSVIFYNFFQTRISAYGTRTEGFVAELMNAISRQLDKGA
ncbi:MAG TPA: MotA/TolQ/ExbB proton channel family protein [Caulobacteraceae bacterium]|nr:MotA/TolQ/ExbB proton channel family protein [Caulobacteraceae bacterium]